MSLGAYFILFISVILAGSLGLLIHNKVKVPLQLVLSFSGAYILGITVLHLMPTIFQDHHTTIGLWVLVGFFIQLFLEQLSSGVEHGHIHPHRSGGWNFAIQVMIGLCLHAFLEGLPLSGYAHFHDAHHGSNVHNHDHLLIGIILHKVPAAFALMNLLLLSKFSPAISFFGLTIFALMSPLGALVGTSIAPSSEWLLNILAMVTGSFLHIATTILFEADDTHNHRISASKILVILTGVGLSLFSI